MHTLIKPVENNFKHDLCPLCQSSLIAKKGDLNYFLPVYYSNQQIKPNFISELWFCDDCCSLFVQNIVSEKQSIELYSQGDAEERWSSRPFEQHKTSITVKKLNELLKPGLKVLDIGCNTGSFLDFAQQKNCKTYGVEYSEASLAILREKGHLGFSSIDQINESFDVITAFDVIEHIYDVPTFLNMCLSKLAVGGKMFFLTGDSSCLAAKLVGSNWWYVRFPEHIVVPSKRYFETHPKVHLVSWTPTLASTAHERLIVNAAKFVLNELFTLDFSGFHWVIPDHALIVLEAKSA